MEGSYQFPTRDSSRPESTDGFRTRDDFEYPSKPPVNMYNSGYVEPWGSQAGQPYANDTQFSHDFDAGIGAGPRAVEQDIYMSSNVGDGSAMDEDKTGSMSATPQYLQGFEPQMANVRVPGGFYEDMMDENFGPGEDPSKDSMFMARYDPSREPVQAPNANNNSPMQLSSPINNTNHYLSPQDPAGYMNGALNNPVLAHTNSVSNMSAFDNGPSPLHQSLDSYGGTNGGAFVGQTPNQHDTAYMAELSPFTTNNSLTPSASSIHSTQPSFFSASQFIHRSSVDHGPPSAVHRHSTDFHSMRPSMDSQQSASLSRGDSIHQGRYSSFTNSISNYIPFMNDRQRPSDALSKVTTPPSPSSLGPLKYPAGKAAYNYQSRHHLRSIFKSSAPPNPNANQDNEVPQGDPSDGGANDTINEYLNFSPKDELSEIDFSDKKLKKTKRSIFTRFKTPVKNEPLDSDQGWPDQDNKVSVKQEPEMDDVQADLDPPIMKDAYYDFISQGMDLAPAEDSIPPSLVQKEPNYAALFQNVGKRRVTKAKQKQTKVKQEPQSEGESGLNSLDSFDGKVKQEHSFELGEGLELRTSHNPDNSNLSITSDHQLLASELSRSSHETQDGEAFGSGIASASKRILGLKLMSKRKSNVLRPPSGSKDMNVEVDLKDLDLPENTKVCQSNDAHNYRIRGRKENKEADLVDESKIYVCSYCSRRFKRQEHLKRHFRSLHTQEKPYDCEICHKKFSRSDNLNQHLKIHKLEGMEAVGEHADNF